MAYAVHLKQQLALLLPGLIISEAGTAFYPGFLRKEAVRWCMCLFSPRAFDAVGQLQFEE